jgi:hypothetical protein
LSDRAKKIVRELEMGDAALTATHLDIIREISEVPPPTDGSVYRPLFGHTGQRLGEVRSLVAKLPLVPGVKKFLNDTGHNTPTGRERHVV